MKSLYRIVPVIIIFILSTSVLLSQDLAEGELKSVDLGTVEFVNYEGPHDRIDSLNQILDIGRSLAGNFTAEQTSSVGGKYRIMRIFDAEAELLSADLFILGSDAQVDHVINLRRILAAYLSEAYGYNFADAELLAEFATYYNAVHRGDMEYFRASYQQQVSVALDPAKAGLATVYSQWPGNTQMLFPLTPQAGSGGVGSIATDALTDEKVIDQLQQEEDKGIPERKDMTELKEREIETQQEQIDESRDEIAAEEQAIAQEEEAIDTAREELEQQKQDAAASGDEQEREQQEAAIAAAEEDLDQREEQVAQREQEVEQQRDEADQAEAAVEERVDRIRAEREQIAEDERSLIEERAEETAVEVPFLYIENQGGLRRLVSSDSKSGRITRRSGINTIRTNDLKVLGDAYLVIAGEDSGNRAVRLVTIDPDSFEMRAQGDTDIYPSSFLLVDSRRIFAVINDNGYRVGRFDASLELQASSETAVTPDTWFTMREGALYAQGEDGDLTVLDPDNLSDIAQE